MSVSQGSEVSRGIAFPETFERALALLAAPPGEARVLAGGTWIMRAPIRGDRLPDRLVSLGRIEGVDAIVENDKGWTIGPMVTHDRLSRHFGARQSMRVLAQAAGHSANPGVRRLATIGGNVATADFPAADLVPALLALGATVTIVSANGSATLPIEDFLHARRTRSHTQLIAAIGIKDGPVRSAHARLTLRRAGEYPVAIASVSATVSANRLIETVRIAIGAVEASPRRWRSLEEKLAGMALDPGEIQNLARKGLDHLDPRDAVDAPAWYRLEVLPHLLRQAFADIDSQTRG